MLLPNLQVSILVDYAHEPESMRQLLSTLAGWRDNGIYNRIIHVVSCDGAGRDDWKKPILGKLSSQHADFSIMTTENYDQRDNPAQILELLTKDLDDDQNNIKFVKVIDRHEAFITAMQKAEQYAQDSQENLKVLIVSTGVGAEQGLIRPSGKIVWDERQIWREVYKSSAMVGTKTYL